jgi:hypothetical protein
MEPHLSPQPSPIHVSARLITFLYAKQLNVTFPFAFSSMELHIEPIVKYLFIKTAEFRKVPQILQLPNKIQKHRHTDVTRQMY